MTFMIILGVVLGSVLIWCSLQGSRQSLRYSLISPVLLQDWKRQRTDLVIVELRNRRETIASEALVIPPGRLNGLLRWIPPGTTLVLCGQHELHVCRAEIELTLLNVGIDVVYILDEDTGSPLVSTSADFVDA